MVSDSFFTLKLSSLGLPDNFVATGKRENEKLIKYMISLQPKGLPERASLGTLDRGEGSTCHTPREAGAGRRCEHLLWHSALAATKSVNMQSKKNGRSERT